MGIFNLEAMQERRDAALNKCENWVLTADELLCAYQFGEREFQGVESVGADFQGADFRESEFVGADLRGAYVRDSDLGHANLQDADLRGANLEDVNLGYANLEGADLRGATLRGAHLRGANLRGADLQETDLQDANLEGADLRGANLVGSDFARANITNARAALGSIRTSGMSSRDDTLDAGINAGGQLIFWAGCKSAIGAEELRAEVEKTHGDSDSMSAKLYLMAIAIFEASFAERKPTT